MCKHAQTVFTTLSPEAVELSAASPIPSIEFAQFLPRMRSLAVVRMLQQSSQVFQTMKLKTLQKNVPFLEFSQVERILVDATKGGAVSVRPRPPEPVCAIRGRSTGEQQHQEPPRDHGEEAQECHRDDVSWPQPHRRSTFLNFWLRWRTSTSLLLRARLSLSVARKSRSVFSRSRSARSRRHAPLRRSCMRRTKRSVSKRSVHARGNPHPSGDGGEGEAGSARTRRG